LFIVAPDVPLRVIEGRTQSALNACHPRAQHSFKASSKEKPAFAASFSMPDNAVSVSGAFFDFRKAMKSVHTKSDTDSGLATDGERGADALFLRLFIGKDEGEGEGHVLGNA
jgi:hypothetical protein